MEEKCMCGNDAGPEGTCPYAEEIHGDYETLCNCCVNCANNCRWDI